MILSLTMVWFWYDYLVSMVYCFSSDDKLEVDWVKDEELVPIEMCIDNNV